MTSYESEGYLAEILAGNKKGLQKIYEEYNYAVFALALSILKDYHQAEDVTQEVFLRIWSNIDSYKFGSNPKAWIMKITKNYSIDVLRKFKKETPNDDIEDALVQYKNFYDENLTVKMLDLQQALSFLPDTDQQIIIMHLVGDISYLSISQTLKMPLATVAWKCSRSITKLKKILKNQF